MNRNDAYNIITKLQNNLNCACPGMEDVVDKIILALLSDSDILLDDYDGSGTVTLMKALGDSIEDNLKEDNVDIDPYHHIISSPEIDFSRDLLESGGSIETDRSLGALFSYILFLENINQLSVETQTRVTQSMREKMVILNGKNVRLGKIFMVVATVNVHDASTTLPQASIARFSLRYEIPMLDNEAEMQVLKNELATDLSKVKIGSIIECLEYIQNVKVNDEILVGLIQLADNIQNDARVGTSGRPSTQCLKNFVDILKTFAFMQRGGSEQWDSNVIWQDVYQLAPLIYGHQIIRKPNAMDLSITIIRDAFADLARRKSQSYKFESGTKDAYAGEYTLEEAWGVYERLWARLSEKVKGRDNDGGEDQLCTLKLLLAALFSEGHILFEDYPGSGKSFMCDVLGNSIIDDVREDETGPMDIESYHRIQATPDLLPSDITGYLSLDSGQLVFKPGPVFAYILLLDEVNRTTPKVQSALLEAMAEQHVTVEGKTYDLGELFFCVATQNPLDRIGTYELPAAQLDRFLFKRRLEPIVREAEIAVLRMDKNNAATLPGVRVTEVVKARKAIQKELNIPNNILYLLIDIADAFEQMCPESEKFDDNTPDEWRLKMGSRPSPRTLQKLARTLKVLAFMSAEGTFSNERKIEPQIANIREIACDLLRHRIFPEEQLSSRKVDELILATVNKAIETHSRKQNTP